MRAYLLFTLVVIPLIHFAQQPAGDAERMLQALKQSGYVKQEGNRIIFKVKKASDTPQIKMMYGALFNNPSYTIAFDVDGKYFERNKPTSVFTDKKPMPFVQKECISDINIITAERMQQNKTISFSGNTMNFRYKRPADTLQFRKLYPCKVRYNKIIYDVVFTDAGGSRSDSLVAVFNNTVAVTQSVKQYEYLKNPDFEMGPAIPHWKKLGEAFNDSHEGSNQLTWKEMKVVKLGGDYWKDLDYARGYHKRYWVTSLKGMIGGTWELRKRNSGRYKGTLTSEPFKIYHFQRYLSFLVGGGNDEQNLKVELLRMQVRPRISGDITLQKTQLPGTQRQPVQTSMDTTYVPVLGVDPKTGHNSEQFRREWWNISRVDTSAYYVISITDNSTVNTGWGFINVDDFRFLDKLPTAYTGEDSLRIHRIEVDDFVNNTKQLVYVDYYTPLFGAADTHTHLMSHLSMGGKLMYGAPDIGSLMTAGTIHTDHGDPFAKDCNTTPVRASSLEQALGNCNAAHGGWGLDNTCGNYLRAMLINVAFDGSYVHRVPFETNMHGDHPHAGYPNFVHWPHFSSMSHQQMYVDWIKRAYEGGLRVLVTLAVNNELLGNMVAGDPPYDDVAAYNLQIDEIKSFVQRHNDFMELALTTADMRRIIQSGKMAVLLGVEVDNLGNFNYAGNGATETKVKAEIQRLYTKGVRYIFPIHLTDNAFGGMAVYSALFAFSNKYARTRPTPDGSMLPPGFMLEVETASDSRINYKLKLLDENLPPGTTAGLTIVAKPLLDFIGEMHFPFLIDLINCIEGKIKCIPQFKIITSLLSEPGWDFYNAVSGGHVNKYGLSPMGKFAVREMMKLGMIIDIDHMSEKSVADAFAIAEEFRYPLISGHNGLREGYNAHPDHKVNENNRSRAQMDRLRNIGGVFGLGIGESDSRAFLTNYRKALSMMGNKAVTMGSDINGFVVMPSPRPGSAVKYFPSTSESAMTKYSFGPANKTWDYNTDGVAHIGLFPDYFQDLKNQGMSKNERQVFFSAADYIMNLWQLCERNKVLVR
ncbi:membrane dipeptidase [Lacibacter sediminis]|uniref:Membrane dipeptidase n=1 Tax=Lacibacter sediminis TaxID=2760713 RepID=A0A7G5XCU5_9BACT|nr:membrane dipeptidase [Lacibacter sediminis]QNA43298.1 membrane dipeptidase [Lacibacter sediminis]